MRDEQHAAARVRKGAQVVEGMHREVEVEAWRGLVGDDEARLLHERAHEQHATRHAAGELVGVEALDLLAQPIRGKQLSLAGQPARGVRPSLGTRGAARHAADLLAHAHERVEIIHTLRHERDPMPAQPRERRRILRDAIEPDGTRHLGVRLVLTHEGVCEHRLSRAARPHDGQKLALVHGEREVMQHLAAAASAGEVRGRRIVAIERHAQVLHGEQVVPAGMMRGVRMAVMVVQLTSHVSHGVATRLQSVHEPPLSL